MLSVRFAISPHNILSIILFGSPFCFVACRNAHRNTLFLLLSKIAKSFYHHVPWLFLMVVIIINQAIRTISVTHVQYGTYTSSTVYLLWVKIWFSFEMDLVSHHLIVHAVDCCVHQME